MKFQWVVMSTILFFPFVGNAVEIPIMGGLKAESHQICGKNIDVEVIMLENHSTLIGLENKQTHNLDLFLTSEQSSEGMNYAKFIPARYDNLSKSFVAREDNEIDIVWGSSKNDKDEVSFSLALGPQTYSCSPLQKWPSEKANEIYGEAP
ncbi:hypothetical protein [Enterobacter sp. ECC-019]|uniref:hypothetical protein n=1 Tax=Enterobacter sp. ECC-019 TaxID=3116478 RepID=UPI003754DD19